MYNPYPVNIVETKNTSSNEGDIYFDIYTNRISTYHSGKWEEYKIPKFETKNKIRKDKIKNLLKI